MCFSATASFSAGAVLLGLGTLTGKSARHQHEQPLTTIPLLLEPGVCPGQDMAHILTVSLSFWRKACATY